VQGPGPVNIVGDMVIVLNQDLEVVWTWDAFDNLDVRRMATQGDMCDKQTCPPLFLSNIGNDWLHGNSLSETPDGNLLYSSRSQDWIIKIGYEHGYGSGSVLWKLGAGGDFTNTSVGSDAWFSHQHDPEFENDGSISLFDNGNIRREIDEKANSRGQVLRLDETKRTAELILNADLGYFSFALGSAQKLNNGNYSFSAGFRQDGSGISIEVDPAGAPVLSLQSTAPEYRTFRMQDMYTP
jgi:arylsulfate sulfotransferase